LFGQDKGYFPLLRRKNTIIKPMNGRGGAIALFMANLRRKDDFFIGTPVALIDSLADITVKAGIFPS
jgi:hypothetical protein